MNFDLGAISTELTLVITAMVVMLADMFTRERFKGVLAVIAFVGVLGAGYAAHSQFETPATWEQANEGLVVYQSTITSEEVQQNFESTRFGMGPEGDGSVIVDNLAVVFRYIFLLGAALTILVSAGYLSREKIAKGEFFTLLLICTVGMVVMSGAADLLMLFLGLETLSIPIYVLAGIQKNRIRSNESSLKYLLMGAFASSFLLYGIAFIYGATGTIRLKAIAMQLSQMAAAGGLDGNLFLLLGVILLFVGFLFKISAVPFHMWTPDVYEGAPTTVTGFMSVAVKAAAFAGLMRVLLILVPFEAIAKALQDSLWIIAVLTMSIGNLIALRQKNIKRMLAFSSIAHAGYLLVGVLAVLRLGPLAMSGAVASILFYLITYTLMNIGAFTIVVLVARKGDKFENVEDFAGLAKKHPILAAGMALFMLSLAGFPPTAGFFAKFYIFSAAVKAGLIPLVIIAVANSLVSVFYYMGPIMAMYFKPVPDDDEERGEIQIPLATEFVLYFTSVAVLLIGIIPSSLIPLVNTIISAQ